MRRFITILAWIALVLVACFDLAFLMGRRLPATHTVSRTLILNQSPVATWAAITDYGHQPQWRSDLKSVERLPDRNGREVWREHYRMGGSETLETTEAVAPVYLVRTIADENGPVAGSWAFGIEPTGRGSRVTITEHGLIRNPFFRFASEYIFRYRYIDDYLKALAGKFKQPPQIQ